MAAQVNQQINLPVDYNNLVIASSRDLHCAGMQPTMGNLALGLQKVLGLKIIPDEDIHLILDSSIAAQYFNKICKKANWKFDLSQFNFSKPFKIKIGEKTVVINLNMQRELMLPTSQQEERSEDRTSLAGQLGLKVIQMSIQEEDVKPKIIVPLEFSRLPTLSPDLLYRFSKVKMPESLDLATHLAGLFDLKGTQNFWIEPWAKSIRGRTLLIPTKSTQKPYERVISKLNEIMSKQILVEYFLQEFFKDSNSKYRKGITQQDINQYFEDAPIEDIQHLLSEINKFEGSNKYYFFIEDFSSNALSSLFERMPIKNLLQLFDDMNSQQKLNILKKIPQKSFKSFIDELSMQDFALLFQNMSKDRLEELQKLKVSDTQDFYDLYFKKFMESYGPSRSITVSEQALQNMNMEQLQRLALEHERTLRTATWRARTTREQEGLPDRPAEGNPPRTTRPIGLYPHAIPMIPPINIRRINAQDIANNLRRGIHEAAHSVSEVISFG